MERHAGCRTKYLLVKDKKKTTTKKQNAAIKFSSLNLFLTHLFDKLLATGEQTLSGDGRLTQRALPGRLQQLGGLLGDHGDPRGLRFVVDVSVGRAVRDDDQPVFLCGRRPRQWQKLNIATTAFAQFAACVCVCVCFLIPNT